jgi:hypothetical protein
MASIITSTFLLFAALIPVCLSGCSSGAVRNYKKDNVITLPSGKALQSQEKIDKYETFMIYFKLEHDVKSIRVGIISEYIADISGVKKVLASYFIVEKAIDVNQFKNIKARYVYPEIGRNFDATDWTREKDITIVSEYGNPFKSLESNSIYRIRFTAFSSDNIDFTIKIEADCNAVFLESQ